MAEEYYKVVLKTGGKTPEQVMDMFENTPVNDEDIALWKKAYDFAHGMELIVTDSPDDETEYLLIAWESAQENKVREFIYLMEQDRTYGSYINDKTNFLKDWENGEYDPNAMICFNKSDVEVLEVLTEKK